MKRIEINKTFTNYISFDEAIKIRFLVCRLKKLHVTNVWYNHNYTDRFSLYSISVNNTRKRTN